MVDDPNNPDGPENNQPPSEGEQPPVVPATPEQDAPPPYTPGVDPEPVDGPRMEADPYVDYDGDDDSEVLHTSRGSSVAINPGKTIIVGVLLVVILVYGAVMFFGDEEVPEAPPSLGDSPTNPTAGGSIAPPSAVPNTIDIPPPPILSTPVSAPPPPPPPPPSLAPVDSVPTPAPVGDIEPVVTPAPPPPKAPELPEMSLPKLFSGGDKERKRRLQAQMLVVSGSKTSAQTRSEADQLRSGNAQQVLAESDPNRGFTQNILQITHSEKAGATRLNDLSHTIGQGKVIDAVLETAINTDLPGLLRGIVSRDIYPEAGRNVMIPKGSRLIGQYNTGIFRGQRRILIVWTRVIRPDGVDIAIGSTATDAMGRAGINGMVDNKYMETFSSAILTSILSIGVAAAADAAVSDSGSTTTNTDGSSTSSGSTGAAAASAAVADFGKVGRAVVENSLDLRPTITVDQGTRMNVFVNRDLVFGVEGGGSSNIGVFQ